MHNAERKTLNAAPPKSKTPVKGHQGSSNLHQSFKLLQYLYFDTSETYIISMIL